MPYLVRTRNGGRSFELRLSHRRLDRPRYASFSTEDEARRIGERSLAALDRGEMPQWLSRPTRSDRPHIATVAAAIREYRKLHACKDSVERLFNTLIADIGPGALDALDEDWVDGWIRRLKHEKHLTPGTIRKRKTALDKVLRWLVRRHPNCLARNPLRDLGHGYSSYTEHDRAALAAQGIPIPADQERNRRIDPDEETRIVEVLMRREAHALTPEARAEVASLRLLFRLCIQTAMRLREAYTLTLDQIDLLERTIHLDRTKNGDRRAVPLTPEARTMLAASWPALEAVRVDQRLVPIWDGDLGAAALKNTTSYISRRFRQVFRDAGCIDLHVHDTRHEAVCRWVLRFPSLTSEELGRAAGMRDPRTRMRYLSLRGSEIAEKFG